MMSRPASSASSTKRRHHGLGRASGLPRPRRIFSPKFDPKFAKKFAKRIASNFAPKSATEVRVEERAELPSEPRSEARTGIGTEVRSHASSARRRGGRPTLCATAVLTSPQQSAHAGLHARIRGVVARSKRVDREGGVVQHDDRYVIHFGGAPHRNRRSQRPCRETDQGTSCSRRHGEASAARRPAANGSARSRAEQDPVVRRMQEKFPEREIRTVIDYREKG